MIERRLNKALALSIVALSAPLVGVFGISGSPEAKAITCGYSVHNEDANSSIAINLPGVGTVDPLGGNANLDIGETVQIPMMTSSFIPLKATSGSV